MFAVTIDNLATWPYVVKSRGSDSGGGRLAVFASARAVEQMERLRLVGVRTSVRPSTFRPVTHFLLILLHSSLPSFTHLSVIRLCSTSATANAAAAAAADAQSYIPVAYYIAA